MLQDIDKNGTEINRHKVQTETGEKNIKKLTKGIEDAKIEREKLLEEKTKIISSFKELEQKAFQYKEKYDVTQKVFLSSLLFCWTQATHSHFSFVVD